MCWANGGRLFFNVWLNVLASFYRIYRILNLTWRDRLCFWFPATHFSTVTMETLLNSIDLLYCKIANFMHLVCRHFLYVFCIANALKVSMSLTYQQPSYDNVINIKCHLFSNLQRIFFNCASNQSDTLHHTIYHMKESEDYFRDIIIFG